MEVIQFNNIFKKVSYMTLFFTCFLFNNLCSQNYADIANTYRSYYTEDYRENVPVRNCVFIINHEQLLTELKGYDKALVYIFVNGCNSKYCQPLYVYENWSKKNGYKLFLVMVNIEGFEQTIIQNPSEQLYVIDDRFYKKRKLFDEFENGLKQHSLKQKNKYTGSLFFFEKGIYVETHKQLPAVQSLPALSKK